MQPLMLVKRGETNYQGGRAGDYSGISVDPVNPNTFWAANEYATLQTAIFNWASWVANFSMEPIPIVLTANQTFVAQVYLDLLHRKYDSPGLAFWSGLLDQNVS